MFSVSGFSSAARVVQGSPSSAPAATGRCDACVGSMEQARESAKRWLSRVRTGTSGTSPTYAARSANARADASRNRCSDEPRRAPPPRR